MSEKVAEIVTVKNARLAFPDLFTPSAFEEGAIPKYGCTLLIPKTNPQAKELLEAAKRVARQAFGKAAETMIKKWDSVDAKTAPVRDGDIVRPDSDGFEDAYFLSAKRVTKPLLMDQAKNKLTEDHGILYSGCYVYASVEIYASKGKNPGVFVELRWVQKFRDGDAFTGGTPVSQSEIDEIEDLSVDSDDLI
jgi:hypothetical protein